MSFDSCANKAAFQLQATDRLSSHALRHNDNVSGPVAVRLLHVLNVKRTTSTRICTAEVTVDAESTKEPADQAMIPSPNANTTGKEPLNKAQPPITVDQITSIISYISDHQH